MPGVRMGIKKENRGILSKSLSNGKGVDRRIMTELDANKKAEELLKGAYDLHVHSSPSVFPRELDGFQLIREADAAGMAGVMLKSHYESTALRAELINRYSGCKAKAYGGLCLNCPAGGLNVYAVKNALRAGAKIVWMPTRDAKNSLVFGNMEGDFFDRRGITILEQDGTLKECVYDIMDAIKEKDAFLATGHISPEESLILCREGRKRGVNMILTIRTVGSGHVYLATDRGQKGAPTPVSELKRFIAVMLTCGIAEAQIRDMVQKVPEEVVCR